MGLGAKIKDALHGDHHEKTTDARPPGAFPQDDIPQKHADGKTYTAPHGSLVDKNRNTTGHATGTKTGTTGSGLGSVPSGGADSLSGGGHHNKLHKEADGYLPSETGQTTSTHGTRSHQPVDSGVGLGQTSGREHTKEGAYWGDLSPSGHATKGTHGLNKDLPDRGHHNDGYSPVGTGQNTSSLPDRTAHGHGHGLGHDQTTGSAGHHNPLHGEQAVGGGVYNTVSGAGSPGYDRSHGSAKPHVSGGAIHDPLTSGTKGTSFPSGTSEYDYKTSLSGAGAPTSRDDRATGPGHVGTGEHGLGQGGLSHGGASHGGLTGSGLSGSGLGGNGLSGSGVGRSPGYGDNGLSHHDQTAGHGNSHAGAGLAGAGVAAAAGYGANELSHRGQGSTGHGGAYDSTSSHHTPGVPRSSMLDVEQPGGVTGSHAGHANQTSGIPHNTSIGSDRGVGGSPTHYGSQGQASGIPHNTSMGSDRGVGGSPTHHGSHGIGGGSPTNVGSGIGSHVGQASSGPGNGHYGPGHPGAKVLHQCTHCGRDDDISHYFKQDVAYRLGQ